MNLLVSEPATKIFDFGTCTAGDLQDIQIPLDMEVLFCRVTPSCLEHAVTYQ